ncbi:hypothetical protein ABTK47_19395, partial [Acinetobacter baumannii]
MNMLRGLLTNIVMVGLLIWILGRMGKQYFFTILLTTLFIGLIVFTNEPYTTHIWYEMFDIKAHFIDVMM